MNRTRDDAVEDLAAKARRAADGEADVDFSTDRDDAVGRLADALSDLAEGEERPDAGRTTDERARFAELFENAPNAVAHVELTDDDAVVREVNPQFTETFGFEAEAVVGESLVDLVVPPEDRAAIEPLAQRVREGGHLEHGVTRLTAEGERAFIAQFVPIGDSGEPSEGYAVYTDVSERRERERKLDALVRNTDDAIYIKDTEGVYRFVNEAAADYFDRRPADLLGTDDADIFDAETAAEIREHDRRVLKTGETVSEEVVRPIDGGERVFLDEKYPYRDGDGEVIGVMGISRDVTERRRTERRLRETNERLNAIVEASPVALVGMDLEGNVEVWNPAAERIFGWSEAEVLGDPVPFVPEDRTEEFERFRDRLADGESITGAETRRQTRDGTELDVSLSVAPLRDGDGEVVGVMGALQDISERKASERQLRRHTEYTDAILDAIDDVFYVLDAEGRFRRWNESVRSVTGYTDDEIDGRPALDFFPEDQREHVATAIGEVFESGTARLEAPYLTKHDETVPYEFVASRLEDPDGNPVLVGIGRDITERREREREAREHRERLSRLMDNIPGMVYRARPGPDWPVEFVSEGVHEIAGYDPVSLERGEVSWSADVMTDMVDATESQIQAALADREPFRFTYPIETADGERRWVKEQGRGVFAEDGSVEAIEGVCIDITERIEYERELERTRDLLDHSQRIGRIGGWEVDVTTDPPGMIWTDEVYRIHEVPPEADLPLEDALDFYHPDDRQRVRDALDRAMTRGDSYDIEARFVTAEGNERWVRSIGKPVREGGEVVSVRGSIQEITDRKERELALDALHEAAQGLLATETTSDVAELVVETATELLDAAGVGVYCIDEAATRLVPIAATDAFESITGGAPPVAVGDDESLVWDCFASGDRLVFDDAAEGDGSRLLGAGVDGGLLVPIGDHGVFVVAAADPRIDEEARRLVETLVATTAAAFDRIENEADLRERDAQLAARNERLNRQIQITEILRRVDQSLVAAGTREEVESAVCDRLVESEDVAFAWIGTDSGGALTPRAWAGDTRAYLDGVSFERDPDGAEPAVRTAGTGEPTVVSNVVAGLKDEPWRQRALANGYHSVVSVPLAVDEYAYGVLTVYGDEPGAFDDLEAAVFAELGQSIANAINAVQARAALHADTLLELTLSVRDDDAFFARIAREADCTVAFEGLVSQSASETRLFFSTSGTAAPAVEAALEELVTVAAFRLVSESEERALFEATVSGVVLPAKLVRHGARLGSISATATETEVVLDVLPSTDVRELVEMLGETYDEVELVSRRDVERTVETRQGLVADLFEELTDRQREVLRTAYFAGFFEWPRQSTGEDVAEMLGVTQPTVNRHLRLGQQRLLAKLFENETPAVLAD